MKTYTTMLCYMNGEIITCSEPSTPLLTPLIMPSPQPLDQGRGRGRGREQGRGYRVPREGPSNISVF